MSNRSNSGDPTGDFPPTQGGIRTTTHWSTKDGDKLDMVRRMPGAGLTQTTPRKVLSERLALKPYWGKPAVRNFREVGGNGATECATRARSRKRRTQTSTRLMGHRASCLLGKSARRVLSGGRLERAVPTGTVNVYGGDGTSSCTFTRTSNDNEKEHVEVYLSRGGVRLPSETPADVTSR